MTIQIRRTAAVGLLALAAALVIGTRLLTAGAEAPPPAPAQSAVTPLPDFHPSEELPADAAVAFPTDI